MGQRTNSEAHERRRITFLGFSIYRAKNRNETGRKTVFQTDPKRFYRAKDSIKQRIRQIKHWSIENQPVALNAILQGHFNYYGIA